MIKAIVFDMDGTLLNSKDEISKKTLDFLINLQKQKIKLILASGRNYRKLLPYAHQLQMELYDGDLIEGNGFACYHIANYERNILHQLSKKDASLIWDMVKPFDVELILSLDDTLYYTFSDEVRKQKQAYRKEHNLSDDFPWLGGYRGFCVDNRIGYPHQYFFDNIQDIPAKMNKICLTHNQEIIQEVAVQLNQKLNHQYEICKSMPRWIEITPKGCSKGSCLKRLMKQYGYQKDEVIVFGDGENDLSMFDQVVYSVAMDNALESVKQHAFAITSNHDEDGIYQFLKNNEHILGIKNNNVLY